MRLIIFILIFGQSVAWAQAESGVQKTCTSVFEYFFKMSVPEISTKDLQIIINQREDSHDQQRILRPFKGQTFASEKHQYFLQKKIGHSTNDIYLGKSEQGQVVAIKTQTVVENLWVYSVMHYEKEVTEFYKINKLPIAQILDFKYDLNRPFYVVEYIQGLSLSEIKKNAHLFSLEQVLKWENELQLLMSAFKKVHQGFALHLQKKNINLKNFATSEKAYQHAIDHLIVNGDIREEQFLYNFVQSQWICIDP